MMGTSKELYYGPHFVVGEPHDLTTVDFFRLLTWTEQDGQTGGLRFLNDLITATGLATILPGYNNANTGTTEQQSAIPGTDGLISHVRLIPHFLTLFILCHMAAAT